MLNRLGEWSCIGTKGNAKRTMFALGPLKENTGQGGTINNKKDVRGGLNKNHEGSKKKSGLIAEIYCGESERRLSPRTWRGFKTVVIKKIQPVKRGKTQGEPKYIAQVRVPGKKEGDRSGDFMPLKDITPDGGGPEKRCEEKNYRGK